jgi:FkbM family methyltransferase
MNADLSAVLRRRLTYPFLRRFAPVQSVRANGRRVFADLRDSIIGRILFLDGTYERALNDVIVGLRSHLDAHWALDIGANIGLHTLALSETVGPSGHVMAFEPEPHNGDLLTRTLAASGARNVLVKRSAAGEREGQIVMQLNASNFGDHRVAASGSGSGPSVPLTTIDAATSAAGIPDGAIRFAKMDVQGYESNVFRGMQCTVERNPEMILAVEVYPAGLRAAGSSGVELMRQIRGLGFDGWELHEDRVLPLADPEVYGLLRGEAYTDVLLSRRREPLDSVLRSLFETEPRRRIH